MVRHIRNPDDLSFDGAMIRQADALRAGRKTQNESLQNQAKIVHDELGLQAQRSMTLAQEKGSSVWLTALPIDDHGFTFSKGDFRDGLSPLWMAAIPFA